MCGICGVIRLDGQPAERDSLERACQHLRHRGPDHTGVWLDSRPAVGLGATRLRVLDPSVAADQPLHHASGRYHLVYNGEVYNFRELRAQLERLGEVFRGGGDTEVVLAACVRWGVEAFGRLNGMWALAFYDSDHRCGFLCRDRFGVKPLCYVTDGGTLRFASELRALSAMGGWDRAYDPDAVVQHLRYGYIADPGTLFARARRLPPGHYLRFSLSGIGSPIRYYDPTASRHTENLSYEDARGALRSALADAVAVRRLSDVPLGAFLSGGLDSSVVVHHLAEVVGRPIRTFAVGFEGHRRYDETRYARLVAKRLGTDHHEVILTQRETLDAVPRILDHLGEPFGDSSILPTALVSEFARRHVTVALSGDGGDELFGGYWRYLGHRTLANYSRLPAMVRRMVVEPVLAGMTAARGSRVANRVRQFRKLLRAVATNGGQSSVDGDPLGRHLAWSRILSPEVEDLVSAERGRACDRRMYDLAVAAAGGQGSKDDLNRVLAFDLQCQLPADMLQKVDLASMMHSLEVRTPFLDYRVVELALSMPGSFKIDHGLQKRVLTDAYRSRLPDEVLDRTKQGFEVPVGEYFRGPLRELFWDTVTPASVEPFGAMHYPAIQRVYAEHVARCEDHADLLWAILSLCWSARGRSP